MGDCVIMELLNETAGPLAQYQAWLQNQATCDAYVVIADESKRAEAVKLVNSLRESGLGADYPLAPLRINKQFKAADQTLARFAFVVGSEFPALTLRNLNSRTEESISPDSDPIELLRTRLDQPDGPLIA